MKIAIVGPGAIGMLLYGLFSRSKEEVWLLDKSPERSARLKKVGLKIEGLSSIKISSPKITSDIALVQDANLWIICVKSYDTKEVLKKISDSVAHGAFVLSIQNGVGNAELLSEALGAKRVLAGVTNIGSTLTEEGVVRFAGEGDTIVGRLDGAIGTEIRDLREIFQKSKLAFKSTKDIQGLLWSKLVINAGINALGALTRLPNGRITEFDGSRRIFREAIAEAVKVAKRKRIKLIYDDPIAKAESVCEATAENTCSMLSDILKKKRTEIDFLNGVIVRQGESLGIKTPVNAFLVNLIKTLESGYRYQLS